MDNYLKIIFSIRLLPILAVVIGVALITAAEKATASETSDVDNIRTELAKIIPQASNAEIEPSPIDGVYRIYLQGMYAFAYVNGDFVLLGDLFNTKNKVNLGDQASSERMAALVKDVPASDMIVFGPKDPQRYITVFTDIDCGFCRKLHNEVGELSKAGIQVRYLAFPRSGIDTPSYDKYVSVWCNVDRQGSLTRAKSGKAVDPATCSNPIADNYNLGREVGVRGTPTIVYDDGTVRSGYVPADALKRALGLGG